MIQGKLSPLYIKHLSIVYSDISALNESFSNTLSKEMETFGPYELIQLENAKIPHISMFAKNELERRNFKH